jgi:hypothetical protein
MPSPADALDQFSSEALRPAALMVGLLFVVFAVQNGLSYPADARAIAVPYDIGRCSGSRCTGCAAGSRCRRAARTSRNGRGCVSATSLSSIDQLR